MSRKTGPIAGKKDGEKLTLWIEKRIKRKAARLAKQEKRSLSAIFENFIESRELVK